MEQSTERPLIGSIFVDVGNPKLRLPQESVICTFEYLSLLGDRPHDRFEGRALVNVAERSRFDLLDYLSNAATDGPEILEPFVPQEPCAIGRP